MKEKEEGHKQGETKKKILKFVSLIIWKILIALVVKNKFQR